MPIRIALLGALTLALPAPSSAQEGRTPSDWGQHDVGFTLIQAYDSTRAFRAKRSFRGELSSGETARPVQVGLWYPARTSPDAPRMTVGEFRLLRESELDFEAPDASARAAAPARGLLDDSTPAVRDAEPVPGPHPTVLYVGAAWVSDPLTAAYLASHGFVVAAFPNNGRMTATSLEFSPNPLTLDTGIDDAGFVYSLLRREPLADTTRLALYAFSATSLHALLWQMRDLQADALVSVEGWERFRRGADLVRDHVQYDPSRLRVPVLLIERAAAEASPSYAKVGDVVDSFAYADVTRVSFEGAEHGDFLSHPTGPGSKSGDRIYARSLEIVRRFLEARLGGETKSAQWMDALVGEAGIEVRRAAARRVAPSEEEIFRLAEVDPAAAAALARELGAGAGGPPFREHVLARAARFAADPADRVVLWRMVADAYPASSDARYRLGTSLAEAGRTAEAQEALDAALAAVSEDPSLAEPEREERRDRIREALESFEPSRADVTIRHLANEGVLARLPEGTVLIDALFGDGLPEYPAVAPATRDSLERGAGEFGEIDLLLVTHVHRDHFEARAVERHLLANPRAHLVASRQVADSLRILGGRYAEIETRVHPVDATPGRSSAIEVAGIPVRALGIAHPPSRNQPVEHLAYVVGEKAPLAHLGDLGLESAGIGALDAAGPVAIALAPHWILTREGVERLTRALAPRCLMGFHVGHAEAERARRRLAERAPDALLLAGPARLASTDCAPGSAGP